MARGALIDINKLVIRISKGNSKVKNTLLFDLPAVVTCDPEFCGGCAKSCYARRCETRLKVVREARKANYVASLHNDFVEEFLATLRIQLRGITYQYARIHSSGDFYSQEYLEKWFQICRELPGVKFLAFTKSFNLDYSDKPVNLTIIASEFGNEIPEHIKFERSVVVKKSDIPNIEGLDSHYFVCSEGDCSTCRFCWNIDKTTKTLILPLH